MRRHGVRAAGSGSRVAHERNLGRAPMWQARGTGNALLPATSVLYGREFRQIAGEPLTAADQRLFAELTTRWLDLGRPQNGRVPLSLKEGARVLGHANAGGSARDLVRASLQRLRRCSLHSRVRHGDGHESDWEWGLLSSFGTTTRDGGRGVAVISDEVRNLLTGESITYLDSRTWDATAQDDDVAARLWVFLETEQFGDRTWRYQLFDDEPTRSLPPIAELLRLSHWAERKTVAHRVRRACRAIEQNDPRYTLCVVSVDRGHWRLDVSKSATRGRTHASPLPPTVVAAWRAVYRQRMPSARQTTVLLELLTRQGAEEIVATLTSAGTRDPFRWLMSEDRLRSTHRIAAARTQERDWAADKVREIAGAKRLGDILQELGCHERA